MNKSDSITELSKAFSLAQAKMPVAQENATNPFLKNKYADLGSFIETAKPVLAEKGLSISQFPIGGAGSVGVETILIHSSGEWISNSIYMDVEPEKGKSMAQVAGSVISYLRRYSLASVLGMYSGDDNDGNLVTQAEKLGGVVTMETAIDPTAEFIAKIISLVVPAYFDNEHSARSVLRRLTPAVKDVKSYTEMCKKYRGLRDTGMSTDDAIADVNNG